MDEAETGWRWEGAVEREVSLPLLTPFFCCSLRLPPKNYLILRLQGKDSEKLFSTHAASLVVVMTVILLNYDQIF